MGVRVPSRRNRVSPLRMRVRSIRRVKAVDGWHTMIKCTRCCTVILVNKAWKYDVMYILGISFVVGLLLEIRCTPKLYSLSSLSFEHVQYVYIFNLLFTAVLFDLCV